MKESLGCGVMITVRELCRCGRGLHTAAVTGTGEPCRRENRLGRRRCWRKGRGKTGDEDKVCCLVSSGQTAPKKGTLYSMML